MTDDFDWKGATLFVADEADAEHLEIESPEEALVEAVFDKLYVDGHLGDLLVTEELRHWLERDEPEITIYGWRRKTIPQAEIETAAMWAVDRVSEELGEEYAGDDPLLDAEHRAALTQAFTADITRVLRDVHVWACEHVASRTYDADEIRAILVADYPELAR